LNQNGSVSVAAIVLCWAFLREPKGPRAVDVGAPCPGDSEAGHRGKSVSATVPLSLGLHSFARWASCCR
jgi:hypothetical protein